MGSKPYNMGSQEFSTRDLRLIFEDPKDLAGAGAHLFRDIARARVAERSIFSVAISGGSTPREMHRLLAQQADGQEIPWQQTHIFWVDERCVLDTDPSSNFGAAKKDFIGAIPIPEDHIHPMPVSMTPEKAALAYQEDLRSFFKHNKKGLPRFDLILLGIGQDGHTASLFPDHPALDEQEQWVLPVKGGHPSVMRLTMTLPLLNQGHRVVFLVSGRGKASIVDRIIKDQEASLPARRVRPARGPVTWLLDRDAAMLISDEEGL